MQSPIPSGHEDHSGYSLLDSASNGLSDTGSSDGMSELPMGLKRKFDDVGFPADRREFSGASSSDQIKKIPPPNGKKTKGRVKIKMEFIDNKLRRYTTFSKRKTGIMKKAYELSTLTGTQVMLLVASETGHVYTFATRKLQPMITSEAGKALIQTCLNSPDIPNGPGSSGPDQRMSATGFEETDLTYSVGEDSENKEGLKNFLIGIPNSLNQDGSVTVATVSSSSESQGTALAATPVMSVAVPQNTTTTVLQSPPSSSVTTLPLLTAPLVPSVTLGSHVSSAGTTTITSSKAASPAILIPKDQKVKLTQGAGFATILASGAISPGTALQIGTLQPMNDQSTGTQQGVAPSPTLYRLPQSALVSLPGSARSSTQPSQDCPSSTSSQNSIAMVQGSQPNISVVSVVPTTSASVSGAVMYQTAQGVVYATPTNTQLPEGVILNLGYGQTTPTGLGQKQDHHGSTTQQFITIPVPVKIATTQQQPTLQGQITGFGPAAASNSMMCIPDLTAIKREKVKK